MDVKLVDGMGAIPICSASLSLSDHEEEIEKDDLLPRHLKPLAVFATTSTSTFATNYMSPQRISQIIELSSGEVERESGRPKRLEKTRSAGNLGRRVASTAFGSSLSKTAAAVGELRDKSSSTVDKLVRLHKHLST